MSSNDEKHYLSGKRIIVSGGGIGGLTFCIAFEQFLRQTSENLDPPPKLIVYERDPSFYATGREGYSLSIRGDKLSGGMQIFQKLGILDQMINNDFTPLMEIRSPPMEDLPQSNIRIARLK
jgi:2-polyprenyl-6-methoxyphenol hydroxylase-like FAD-dependent oxidoreductase